MDKPLTKISAWCYNKISDKKEKRDESEKDFGLDFVLIIILRHILSQRKK